MSDFVKLSQLVGQTFTVTSVNGFKYKLWGTTNRKMLIADTQLNGYRKVHQVLTDKGQLDLGTGQMGTLLEAVAKDGTSTIIGKTFEVASNGKTGMDIRYFFNPKEDQPAPVEDYNQDIKLSDIPF